jgi:hypothetical protein
MMGAWMWIRIGAKMSIALGAVGAFAIPARCVRTVERSVYSARRATGDGWVDWDGWPMTFCEIGLFHGGVGYNSLGVYEDKKQDW